MWSSTKNMASLCIYILSERGLLNFHDPVSKYWPEFSKKGKQDILISHIMSHSQDYLVGKSLLNILIFIIGKRYDG